VLALVPPADTAGLLAPNGTLVAELIAFVIMLGILGRYAYPPIMRAAETRQKQIEEGVKAAQEAEKRLQAVQKEVEETLAEARGQAREMINRAHHEAAAEAEELRDRGRRDAEAQVEKARGDIQAEKDRAVQELRAQVSALVVEAAGRVLGAAIDEKAHARLIEESLQQVSPGS
jgi:F-type H+-transporting ATPase subunit b